MDDVRPLFRWGKTPEDVFSDYKGRRAGILKALTTDADQFFQECDPEKGSLCLFGYSDESWRVAEPNENVPTDVPEPTVGINFYCDIMPRKEWLEYVALHSDAWLLSLSFFLGSKCWFDKTSRKTLFDLMNELPTVYEIVSTASNPVLHAPPPQQQNEEEEEELVADVNIGEEEGGGEEEAMEIEYNNSTPCAACGKISEGFWICCDTCELWFHGECVNVTPEEAKHIDHYECPTCFNN